MKKSQSQVPPTSQYPNYIYGYPYYDSEIQAVNTARNNQSGYLYYKGTSKGNLTESGILMQGDRFFRDYKNRMVIELPASASQESAPIGLYLDRQMEFLRQALNRGGSFPVKILFPYKLRGFHWNVGEIIISQKDGSFEITGCRYDSNGYITSLEDGMKTDVTDALRKFFPKAEFNFNVEEIDLVTVQTGLACGLYAARAMHNLKRLDGRSNTQHIWSGVFDGEVKKDERALREEDYDFVTRHNPGAINTFCKSSERQIDYGARDEGSRRVEADIKSCLDGIVRQKSSSNDKDFQDLLIAINLAIVQNQTSTIEVTEVLRNLDGRLKGNPFYKHIRQQNGDKKLHIPLENFQDLYDQLKDHKITKVDSGDISDFIDYQMACIHSVVDELKRVRPTITDGKKFTALKNRYKIEVEEGITNNFKGEGGAEIRVQLLNYFYESLAKSDKGFDGVGKKKAAPKKPQLNDVQKQVSFKDGLVDAKITGDVRIKQEKKRTPEAGYTNRRAQWWSGGNEPSAYSQTETSSKTGDNTQDDLSWVVKSRPSSTAVRPSKHNATQNTVNLAQNKKTIEDVAYKAIIELGLKELGSERNVRSMIQTVVEALQKQEDKINPDGAYVGIGVGAVVANINVAGKTQKVLQIQNIFAPEKERFYFVEQRSFVKNASFLEGKYITSVNIGGTHHSIDRLISDGEEGMKKIAGMFHSGESNIEFTLKDKNGKEYNIGCERQKNSCFVTNNCPSAEAQLKRSKIKGDVYNPKIYGLGPLGGNEFIDEVITHWENSKQTFQR